MNRHTRTLSILHTIWGALQLFGALVILLLFMGGSYIASEAAWESGDAPPDWAFGLIKGMGVGLFLLVATFGVLNILSGIWITKRINRTASMVIAGFNCLSVPLGLALGIYTFIILTDDQVKQEYSSAEIRPI
jgi:hypothetical protein